jgi:hypothetical protein
MRVRRAKRGARHKERRTSHHGTGAEKQPSMQQTAAGHSVLAKDNIVYRSACHARASSAATLWNDYALST